MKKLRNSPMMSLTKQKAMDIVVSPQKCHALNKKGNILSNEMEVSQDVIEDDLDEEPGQGDTMAWVPMCSDDMSPEMTVVPATGMSLGLTDKDVDGEGEVGDTVDGGVNGNEDDEIENEELGSGDVVNQSHMAPVKGNKKWLPHKQKVLSDLYWHLTAFLYKSLLVDNGAGMDVGIKFLMISMRTIK